MKHFLNRVPPPGYIPGAGRGAVGFTTERARPPTLPGAQRGAQRGADQAEVDRFVDADDEADAIYAAIDRRRKRKHKVYIVDEPEKAPEKLEVSLNEWLALPAARNATQRNKRLRAADRRFYAVPDSVVLNQSDATQQERERHRPMLEKMLRQQPRNPEGYLQLAKLEQDSGNHSRARTLIERGTIRVPQCVELWLRSIDFQRGADALSAVAKACDAVPHSESIWLKRIELEMTRAAKLQTVHVSLTHCPTSVELWLQAAQLEPLESRSEVLRTALEFVDTPHVWLALCDLDESAFKPALQAHPHSLELWVHSIEHGLESAETAVASVDRAAWLAFLKTYVGSAFESLVNELKLQVKEASELGVRAFVLLPRTPELYLAWSQVDSSVLAEAVREFPTEQVVRAYAEHHTDFSQLELSAKSLELVVNKLFAIDKHEMVVAMLPSSKRTSLPLWLAYIRAAEHVGLDVDVDEAVKLWPHSKELLVRTCSREQALHKANADDHPWLVNEFANRELGVKRRALLSQATATYPQFAPLWLSRVRCEQEANKPYAHLLAEALRYNPTSGELWVAHLQAQELTQRKKLLVEAVRATRGSREVLLYGANILGDTELARKWRALASSE